MGKFKKIFYSQKIAPFVFVLPFILSLKEPSFWGSWLFKDVLKLAE